MQHLSHTQITLRLDQVLRIPQAHSCIILFIPFHLVLHKAAKSPFRIWRASSLEVRPCEICKDPFSHVQVDVIEVQYAKLLAAVGHATDLKAAETAHEAFLAACVVQSSLDVPMFSSLLSKNMSVCKAFCASMQAGSCIRGCLCTHAAPSA